MKNIFLIRIIILIIVSSGLATSKLNLSRNNLKRFVVNTGNSKRNLNLNEIRLPKNLTPYYYELYFIFDFNNEIEPTDYIGKVRIFMNCNDETNKLILNVKNLEINETSIVVEEVDNIHAKFNINNTSTNLYKQMLNIEFEENFEFNHNYSITIDFKGFLKDDDHGFFRQSYLDKRGNKK